MRTLLTNDERCVNQPGVSLFDFTSMFLLGLMGSAHCLGMCGPLVLAFPARSGRVVPQLLYHLGRSGTYVLMAAIIGLLAQGVGYASNSEDDPLGRLARLQIAISSVGALMLFVFGLVRLGAMPEPRFLSALDPTKNKGFSAAGAKLSKGNTISMLPLGLLMGLLPCGLSYAALARCLATPSPAWAAGLMGAFALGTLPALLVMGTVAASHVRRHARAFDLLAGILMVVMAISLLIDAWSTL
jgi:sulfite exporter TauE/SafE